jgi:hypothetical protein
MKKLFAALAATLMLAAVGTALTAESFFNPNDPALTEASSWEGRQQITSDVIDGRLSLLEAAAAFRDLNLESPALVVTYPGSSEGEKACREVIAWVRVELEARTRESGAKKSGKGSVDSAAVLARLEAELKAAKGKDGSVHLGGDAS